MSDPLKPKRRVLPVGFWRRRRESRQPLIAVFPTLLTLGNAVCGFTSVMLAAKATGPSAADSTELYYAALLIFGAMIFDALDGPVARLSRRASDFGAQLDSLSDAVSFGVAPAFLMLQATRVLRPRTMWVIAVLYLLGALLRLARFNTAKDSDAAHLSFRGLPSPAAAGTVAALVIFAPGLTEFAGLQGFEWTRRLGDGLTWLTQHSLPWVTALVAGLMISRIRYPHAVNTLLLGRSHFYQIALLVFAGFIVFAVHELAIPCLFLGYVAIPPLRALMQVVTGDRTDASRRSEVTEERAKSEG